MTISIAADYMNNPHLDLSFVQDDTRVVHAKNEYTCIGTTSVYVFEDCSTITLKNGVAKSYTEV